MFFFRGILILFLFFSIDNTQASDGIHPVGARAVAIGNTSATLRDQWALFHNISGTAYLKDLYVGFSFENNFGIAALNRISASFICPIKYGVPSIGIFKFGDEYYNEHLIKLGYAYTINRVSLGIQANYTQISIEDVGTKHNIAFALGGIIELSNHLFFGAHIYNFNQAKIEGGLIPVTMNAGLSYNPSEKIMINIETAKDVDKKAAFRGGIEYTILEKLRLRTGISSSPFINYFGFGIILKNTQLDYAFSTHPQLGFSHQISLSYKFNKKRT